MRTWYVYIIIILYICIYIYIWVRYILVQCAVSISPVDARVFSKIFTLRLTSRVASPQPWPMSFYLIWRLYIIITFVMRCSQTVAYTTQKGTGPFPPGDRIMYVRLAFSRREGSCTYIYILYLYSYNTIFIYIRIQRAQQWDRRYSLFLTTRRRLLYYSYR